MHGLVHKHAERFVRACSACLSQVMRLARRARWGGGDLDEQGIVRFGLAVQTIPARLAPEAVARVMDHYIAHRAPARPFASLPSTRPSRSNCTRRSTRIGRRQRLLPATCNWAAAISLRSTTPLQKFAHVCGKAPATPTMSNLMVWGVLRTSGGAWRDGDFTGAIALVSCAIIPHLPAASPANWSILEEHAK